MGLMYHALETFVTKVVQAVGLRCGASQIKLVLVALGQARNLSVLKVYQDVRLVR